LVRREKDVKFAVTLSAGVISPISMHRCTLVGYTMTRTYIILFILTSTIIVCINTNLLF